MPLSAGTRLGSYEILNTLGEGGMGQVYRARDSKLNRDVALKVLPATFATDPERLSRFRREAQVLASLNHPNIAQIYDTGSAVPVGADTTSEVVFLAMELVPGRTLAEIIDSEGALAPDAAVHMAIQIAEALEAAHEQGIIHRDLKPANIKRRDDDVVKVLDFGLARAMDSAAVASGDSPTAMNSPTMLSPAATQMGVILGTAGYMSPEQAKGRVADKRADIWAFGVVLYELLTGKRLFGGDTVTEVIASVIKDAPSLDALPSSTPPRLRQLLARCLERDPKLRLRDIGEARIALRSALDVAPAAATPAHGRSRVVNRALFAVGAFALAGIAAFIAWRVKPDTARIPVRRFVLPSAMSEADAGISPDGNRIAYLHDGHLYVHSLTSAQTADLGTVPPTAESVTWSPDNRTIAYAADSSLRTVPAAGGVPFTVCKIPASGRLMGVLWRKDGTIVFTVWRDSLYRVAAVGGTPALVNAVDPATEIDFHSVTSLPDGRFIVTTHLRGQDQERGDIVDGNRRTPLTNDPEVDSFQFVAPSFLLFRRRETNPGVWAVPFDGSVDPTKATIVEPGALGFDSSSDGTLIVRLPAKDRRELVWVTNAGGSSTLPGEPFEMAALTPVLNLSPDARRAVMSVRGADGLDQYVIRDLITGAETRLPSPRTGSGGVTTGANVTWRSKDRLLFAAGGVEQQKIFDWPADGSSNGRELVGGMSALVTPDGKTLVFNQDMRSRSPLFQAPLLPDGSAGTPVPVFQGKDEPDSRYFDLSPDGKLLAFTTTNATTVQSNIFIATFPDLRERRQVTSDGGVRPQFSADNRSLYYMTGTRAQGGTTKGQLKVVSISTTPLTVGTPTLLLTEGEGPAGGDRPLTLGAFDAGPDGRLLMTRRVPTAPGDEARMVVLQNWMDAIKK